ncbi:HAMP domain-containing protein [Ramlibacter sp. G-1-2-2]|uniref:HAMP domain-containing protein n=1 Tax=Ramlibacter agri TaxID=2728837 RepID=A0A848HD40_9BURK|nr:methyl-accepting chemotaxis protein [Ramlibacter agri]NML47390.1 HAMP domain-containing protein [Ramlibacter agri]
MELGTGGAVRGRYSIRQRLGLAFGLFTLLLAAMAGVGAWRLAQLSAVTKEMAAVNLRMERLVGEWLAETKTNTVRAVVLTRGNDPELKRLLTPAFDGTAKRINALSEQVEKLLDDDQPKALFARINEARQAYLETRKSILDKQKAGDDAAVAQLMETAFTQKADAYLGAIKALGDHYTAEVEADAQRAAQSAESGGTLLATFCGVGMAFAVLGAWLITRSITRPLYDAMATVRRVADGDLTVQIAPSGTRETAQLLHDLATMTDRLRALVGEVAQGAGTVAETSAQIAQGNLDLSQRTEEQASTLEETASSMEELTTTVGQNAEHARQASQLADGASRVAREGGAVVGQVVRTMTGISDSSKKIAEIIGVIDGIAFQTNILALNAAVEAARAGEQGRGFAVVATEVRNLAQRSASAAKEIKGLITESAQQVEAGTRQADAAGLKMQEVVQSALRVSELITEIASASQEQSNGIEQINAAVIAMDQGVQQNASLVEEATAATESMRGQASALLHAVSRFRLGESASVSWQATPAHEQPMALPALAAA